MYRDRFLRSTSACAVAVLLAWAQMAVADGWTPLYTNLGYFQKLGAVKEAYYVTTPSVLRPGAAGDHPPDVPGNYEAYLPPKSKQIEPGYVVYYKDGDKIDALLARARRNMAAIRKAGYYTVDDKRDIDFHYGPLPLGNFSEMTNALCHFSLPLDLAPTAVTMVYGLDISNEQICVGYGVLAAVTGFDVEARGKTLALKPADKD
jgi:hypothetical protein